MPLSPADPSHITKHSIKDILNLVWLVISHYSWSETMDDDSRALLLDWVNAALPDKHITDFTTCWSDGVNLLALVNSCRPGLVPDLSSIDPTSGRENITLAMKLAKDNFFIPQVMSPQDLAVDRPDERSVMTYLSYFSSPKSSLHKALFLWVKQQLPEAVDVTNLGKDWVNGTALGALVNSLSSGVFTDYEQFDSSQCIENCQAALDAADTLLGANKTLTAQQFADPHLNLLRRSSYLLQLHGSTLKVTVDNVHRPSEYGTGQMMWVDLALPGGNLSMIQSSASGLNLGALETVNEDLENGIYRVSIETVHPDEYSLSLTVGGLSVTGSPFSCSLAPPSPQAVQHLNTVLPRKVGIPVILSFDVSHAGQGELSVEAVGNLSGPTPVTVDTSDPARQKVSFIPMQSETFSVRVMFSKEEVSGSPFQLPLDSLIHPETIKLSIPVVEGPGTPVLVTLDSSKAGNGQLEAHCTGTNSGAVDVTVSQLDDHTEISFTPAIEDMYYLSVAFDGTEVVGSPLRIDLYPQPPVAAKVELSSPPSGALETGCPISIGFNTTQAGQGIMTATCHAHTHGDIPIQVDQTAKHDYQISFTPPDEDVYNIHVLWSDKPIKGSPFKLDLISKDHPQPNNCIIQGAPLTSDLILTDEEITFHVSTANAGKGTLTVTVDTGPNEATSSNDTIGPQVMASSESEHTVKYTPTQDGDLTMEVLWAGEPIPGSPLSLAVITPQVSALGSPVIVNLKTVYKRKHLKAYAISRRGGAQLKVNMDKIASGDYKLIFQPSEPGVYLLHVSTKDKPIPHSPFIIRCVDSSNPEAIKISGLVDEAKVGQPMEFVIDAKDAGYGDITVAPLGSMYSGDSALTTRDADVRSVYLRDNKDGTYSAVFTPESAGMYACA